MEDYTKVVKAATRKYKYRRDYEDIYQEAWIGCLQAAKNNSDFNYLFTSIRHWLYNNYFKKDYEISSNEISMEPEILEEYKSTEMPLPKVVEFKNDNEKIIYNYRKSGYTYTEIGELLGLKRNSVCEIYLKLMRRNEQK